MKRTALKRKTPLPRPKARLRPVSAKRQAQQRRYSVLRRKFLARPENQWCPVAAAGLAGSEFYPPLKRRRATEIHHTDGREGELLNEESKWLAVSREGHQFIHANPAIARERGWLL